MNNLIGPDIKLMRSRYDEALNLQGIPCMYQYPILPDTNEQGESVIDSYSVPEETFIFFEGSPKIKTFKRYGWVVENSDELPFLVHCSFNLKNLQRDSIFKFAGQYTEVDDRVFKVTEISYDIQAPDHLVCQVVPVYEKQYVGRTSKEVKKTFNKSENFIKQPTDYRGNYIVESDRYRRKGNKHPFVGELIRPNEGNQMLKVYGDDIQITRADTGYFNINIKNPDNSYYKREDGDSLVFTVKKTTETKNIILQKEIDGLTLQINPEDTKDIDYGTYKYDIQLTTKDDQVFTVVGPATFTIRSEVTF